MAEEIWFHIDVNSAFLSWEAAYRRLILGEEGDLREIPSVVGGSQENRHGIVLAKSIPAKQYRIQTGEPLQSARSKCPDLTVVPPNYELYVACSKALMKYLQNYSDEIHPYSIDEAFCNMTGTAGLFGSPVIAAEQLRTEIKEHLGFTVNIGVSTNKLLAKMASEFRKPDRVHTLFPEEIPGKMWELPVGELFYVGRATEKKLHGLGIRTIGALAGTEVSIIRQHLKKPGEVIWNYANGNDISPFLQEPEANKGYGNSMTVSFDVCDRETARQVILSLTETVAARLRADGAKVRCLGISLVNSDFSHQSRQQMLVSATDTTIELYRTACAVFDALWDNRPVRQFGVYTGAVTRGTGYQYNLFDLERFEKHAKLDAAVDAIRSRYGEDAIMRATFLDNRICHMSGGIDKAKRTGITNAEGGFS